MIKCQLRYCQYNEEDQCNQDITINSFGKCDNFQETQMKSKYISHFTVVRCPECGATLILSEGCQRCLSCGWSKCG